MSTFNNYGRCGWYIVDRLIYKAGHILCRISRMIDKTPKMPMMGLLYGGSNQFESKAFVCFPGVLDQ